VRIKSADPRHAPAIHPNYLATQKDRDTLVAGVKALRRIAQAPPLARHIAEEVDPGSNCASDDAILDFIRRRGSTVYHPVSTCRMGQDPKAVVDERLRVRGFERLRVIDASIMPAVVSGNTPPS
jgi:choline dehydrogenase